MRKKEPFTEHPFCNGSYVSLCAFRYFRNKTFRLIVQRNLRRITYISQISINTSFALFNTVFSSPVYSNFISKCKSGIYFLSNGLRSSAVIYVSAAEAWQLVT